jgi:phosphonate transport system ATP-binding protein
MSQQTSIIQLDDVQVNIGERCILNNISLKIGQAELVTLVGPNGAGKSTLLKVLTRIQGFSKGQVQILNHDVHASMKRKDIRELRSEVAQVFQGLHLVPRLTVLENVLIGRLSLNRSFKTWARIFNQQDHAAALNAMITVGISHHADHRVDRLSGGERQKVAIARALAQNTKLLLADEPTSNLDPQAAVEIAQLLRRLVSENNITIVTVIHDLSLLSALNGRVVGLKAGHILFDQKSDHLVLSEVEKIYRSERL